MPFQYNIPLAADQLSVSQGDINGNFQALGAIAGGAAGANSNSLNAAAGFNFLYIPVNAGSPPAGTAFGAVNAIYSFFNANSNQNSIYINQNTFAGVKQVPATSSILGTVTPVGASNGWTFLPSGLLMKWGFQSCAAMAIGTNTIVYPAGPTIPAFTGVPISLQINLQKNTASASPVDLNARAYANINTALNFQVDIRISNGIGGPAFAVMYIAWVAIGLGV